ncbi:DMT family transporter [Arcobacter sp. LA11]|uniref:DMT family transporter n=1 Tax=Arcobacter sp. LA11 TaxID=1898176 RepID=UPI000933483D|nr:DMT family transporter [Arcobacter sp. LA11]
MTNKTKGTILVLICVALWAMIPPAAKFAQSSLDNHQFLFWSSLISFICLFFTAIFKQKVSEIKKYSRKDWLSVVILGLLGTYVYYLFLYLGYKEAKGLEVLVVQYTWPISIVVFSLFLLKERLTVRKTIAVLLGFFGVLIVLTKGNFSNVHVDNFSVIMLVLLGASSFALFSVLSKKIHLEPISVTSIYFLSATIASLFSMFYFSSFAMPTLNEWFPILLNGVFLNGFSYLLWINALKMTEASYLAPFVFITPILSAIYLILLFDEPIKLVYVVGLICVVIAGLVNSYKLKKED